MAGKGKGEREKGKVKGWEGGGGGNFCQPESLTAPGNYFDRRNDNIHICLPSRNSH